MKKSEFYITNLKLIDLKKDLFELCQVNDSFKLVYQKYLETLEAANKAHLIGNSFLNQDEYE